MKCLSCQLESYRMTQVRWLGTRGLTIITSGNNNTTTRLKRGPNPLFGVLIPRPWEVVILSLLSMSPSSPRLQRGPDPLSGILITRPPGDNHNNNKGLTHCYHGKKAIWHGGPILPQKLTMWVYGAKGRPVWSTSSPSQFIYFKRETIINVVLGTLN